MDRVSMVILYNGKWVPGRIQENYVGGEVEGIVVSRTVTYEELVQIVHGLYDTNNSDYEVDLRVRIALTGKIVKYMKIKNDAHVAYIIQRISEVIASAVVTPLIASVLPRNSNGIRSGNRVLMTGNSEEGSVDCVDGTNTLTNKEAEVGRNTIGKTSSTNTDSADGAAIENCDVGVVGRNTLANEEVGRNAVGGTSSTNTDGADGVSDVDSDVYLDRRNEQSSPAAVGSPEEDSELMSARTNRNPNFDIGQVYATKQELLKKFAVAALKGQFEYNTKYSNATRVCVECAAIPCPWRVRGIRVQGSQFMITKCTAYHTCDLSHVKDKQKHATAKLIGDMVKRKYSDCQTVGTPLDIVKAAKNDLGLTISYEKAWRARKYAMEN